MQAGELGVDYVHLVSTDSRQLIERVAWWSELFITPCVAKAESLEEILPLAQVGTDFIMLEDVVWSDPRHPGAAMSDALACLQGAHV
jgi:thiamine-phosphate pyrophosphorylase